jgi:hypothetical protein
MSSTFRRPSVVVSRETVVNVALLILAVAVTLGQQAAGQTTVGIQPLGSYADGGLDQISLANLGLHIDVPLYQHKGRGSGQGIDIHLVYDTTFMSTYGDRGWRIVPATAAPGSITVSQDQSDFVSLPCPIPYVGQCNAGYTNYTYSFAFTDSTGYSHQSAGSGATSVQCNGVSALGCTNVNLNADGYSYDNSGYLFQVNPGNPGPKPTLVTVTAPSGEVYSWTINEVTAMTDPNGNTGTASIYGGYFFNGTQTFTDDSNVSATISGGGFNTADCNTRTSRAPVQVQYLDTSGNPQTVTINYFPMAPGCNPPLVESVVYPDGTSYQFAYQPDDTLASMTLPTGGTINFATSSIAQTQNGYVGLPATVSRSTPDGTTVYTQTATPCSSPGCIYATLSSTSVAKPDGSSEQINFVYYLGWGGDTVGVVNPNYETAHKWYSASGTLLKSTMRCYNGATGDCTTTPIVLPITQISTTTTLDNGLSSETVEYLNSIGLVTEVDEYGFGASSPTRKTVTTYATLGNIGSRPASVIVYDSGGNIAKETTYGYDESSLAPTSNLPGHNAVTGARGNMTSEHAWPNAASGTLDSHWNYDDAGQVLATQDPRLYWTNYGLRYGYRHLSDEHDASHTFKRSVASDLGDLRSEYRTRCQ